MTNYQKHFYLCLELIFLIKQNIVFMKRIIFLLLFLLCGVFIFAQEVELKGVVKDQSGQPLPGVSVTIKGTQIGAATDANGAFTLKAETSKAKTLAVSFMGYKAQEIEIGATVVFAIALEEETKGLDEVVVTAMGIKREKKSINYAIQDVKAEDIMKSKDVNLVNSLQGRIAGVNITRSGGQVGSSSTIIIRGGQSLLGNNEPLWIVDGIPIDNSSVNGNAAGLGTARYSDGVNRAADIDPNDIESMTVLKGAAASALYGVDAAGGAIVVTTKKGEKGEGKISYSNNFSWSYLPNFPEEQTTYGYGDKNYYDPELTLLISWGPKISDAGGKVYNNADNFFKTGFMAKHSIEFSNASDEGSVRISGSRTDQTGVTPNTDYDNTKLGVAFDRKIKKWLNVTGKADYIQSNSKKPEKGGNGFYRNILDFPRNYDMSVWQNPDGTQSVINSKLKNRDNPYWSINNSTAEDNTNRLMSNLNLTIKPLEDNSLLYTVQGGLDYYVTEAQYVWMPGTLIEADGNRANIKKGAINEYTNEVATYNINSNLKYIYDKIKDFVFDAMFGIDAFANENRYNNRKGIGFQIPGWVSINNFDANGGLTQGYTNIQKRRFAALGELKAEYKKMIYLSGTFRNDWSSTLPKKNQAFQSPSISLGFIASELFPSELKGYIDYFKVNAIWAKVGKDALPNIIETTLFKNDGSMLTGVGASGGFFNGYSGGAPDLKPETTTSYEIGFQSKFLNNRFGFDFNYYNQVSKDMIIMPRLSYASGYIMRYINGGEISNKGVEISLYARPINDKDFKWDILLNFAKNVGILESLPYPLDQYYESESWVYANCYNGSKPGEPYSTLLGFDYQRSPDGKIICDKDGKPVRNISVYAPIGNKEPDFTIGLTNTLSYMGFTFSMLIDIKKGGDVYNGTAAYMVYNGKDPITEDRDKQVIVDGVQEVKYTQADVTSGVTTQDKVGTVKEYVKNTTPIKMDKSFYQTSYAGTESNFIEDASWVRIRNISLSYDLPKDLIKKSKMPISRFGVVLTAENVALWTPYTGVDPETNTLGSGVKGLGGAGIDYGTLPATKSFSIGFNVTF